MPAFEYKGLNTQGKNVKGVVEADNAKVARAKLKREGIYVVDMKDKKQAGAARAASLTLNRSGSVSIEDLSLMTRQLAVLVKSQIPLVDALAALVDQVENPTLRSAVSDIKQMVNEGSSFHKALQKYPKIFDNIFISMCEAGEMTGTLDVILIRLAEFTESQNELRSKVKSAMMYPVLMMIASFLVLMGLFVYVIPQITKVFEDMGSSLPWYTEVTMAVSRFMVDYYVFILIALALGIVSFVRWKSSPSGRPVWDATIMKIPIVGKLVRMVIVSRFCRTLGTLLTGGVPMLNAFDIVKNVVDNKVFERVILDARENVSKGESVAAPLKKSGEFPPLVIHMISIGEKTGELENMLNQVSTAYDFQVNNAVNGLTSLLGPIMVIFMGGVIGFIVFSVLVPIFELTGNIGG